MGKVRAIAIRKKTRAPMTLVHEASVTFANGVGDDSRGKKRNNRQVTVLTQEGWEEASTELEQNLEWTTRRANIFITGLNLESSEGKFLKIGTSLLKITGELVPCNRMDEQIDGLTNALAKNWRGGVTCAIEEEGYLKAGDSVSIVDQGGA